MTWHPLDSEFHQRKRDPEAVRKELEEKRRKEREAYLRLPEQQRRLMQIGLDG